MALTLTVSVVAVSERRSDQRTLKKTGREDRVKDRKVAAEEKENLHHDSFPSSTFDYVQDRKGVMIKQVCVLSVTPHGIFLVFPHQVSCVSSLELVSD